MFVIHLLCFQVHIFTEMLTNSEMTRKWVIACMKRKERRERCREISNIVLSDGCDYTRQGNILHFCWQSFYLEWVELKFRNFSLVIGNEISSYAIYFLQLSGFSCRESGRQILLRGPPATRIYNCIRRKIETTKGMHKKPRESQTLWPGDSDRSMLSSGYQILMFLKAEVFFFLDVDQCQSVK